MIGAALAFGPIVVRAQTVWVGGAGTGGAQNDALTAGNWTPATVPGSTVVATFDTSKANGFSAVTASGTLAWAGIAFTAGGVQSYTFTPGSAGNSKQLTLGGSGIVNGSSVAQALGASGSVFLAAAAPFTQSGSGALSIGSSIANAGFQLTLNGASGLGAATVSGAISGSGGLAKADAGTWTLTAGNTYSGATVINGGTLALSGSGAIAASSGVEINSGTLDISATTSGASVTTLSGTGGTTLGAKTLTVTNGSTTYGGVLSGSGGGLTLTSGAFTLTAASTYTGATAVNGGVLNIQNSGALGTTAAGTMVATGGTLQLQGGISVGSEALTLNGTGFGGAGALNSKSGANSWSGAITLGSATHIDSDSAVSGDNLTLSGGISGGFGLTVGGAGNTTINGNIATGTGSLTKDGSGTLLLSGSNTYTGVTTVNAGTLKAGSSTALGNSSSVVVNANAGGVTATLDLNNFNETIGALTFGGIGGTSTSTSNVQTGTGTLTLGGNVTYDSTGNPLGSTLSGNLALGAATRTFTVNDSSVAPTDLTVSAVVSGSAVGLTKTGAGTLALTGVNSYTGATTISGGTLAANTIAAGGLSSAIGAASNAATNLIIDGGALSYTGTTASSDRLFQIGNFGATLEVAPAATVLTLSNPGSLTTTGSGTRTLTLSGAGSGSLAAVVVDGNSATSINKTGAGTWTLLGSSSYSGTTTVSGGTLRATTNANALGLSTVALSGGTLELANSSGLTFGRPTTVSASSTIRSDVLGAGNGVTHTLGTLSIGAQQLNVSPGANVTGGTAGITFGAVTLTGGATFAPGVGALLTLASVAGNTQSFTVTGAGNTAISGAVSTSTGGLTKNGTGTLTLAGADTYSGLTTVAGGVLKLSNASALPGGIGSTGGSSALTLNGGVVGLAIGDFARGLGAGVTQVQFTGSGGFAAYGAARTVNLGGASAAVTWNSGSFVPTGSALVLGAADADNTVTFVNPINLAGGTGTVQVENGSALTDAVLSGSLSNGAFTKAGAGTLTLSGNNSYAGKTTVAAGVLSFGNGSALGGNSALDLGVAGTSSGVLNYTGGAINFSKNINALGNGSDTVQNSGSGLLTLSGTLAKNGTSLTLKGGTNGINVTGAITGSAAHSDLIVDGGTTTLSTTNSYNGPTYVINGATLNANAPNALGAGALTISSGTVNVAADQTLSSLAGSGGTIDFGSSASTLTLNAAAGASAFQGAITGSGSGGVTVIGGGAMALSGTISYRGATVVSGGSTLAFSGNVPTGSSGYTAAGGTLAFNNPGSSTLGLSGLTLNQGGALVVSSSLSSLALQFDKLVLGAGNGVIDFNGSASSTIAFGSATSLVSSSVWSQNSTLTVANYTTSSSHLQFGAADQADADAIASRITFGSLSSQAFALGNSMYEISAVPEPSTCAAMVGITALAVAGWRRRAHQRKAYATE